MPVPPAMLAYARSIKGKPEADELAKALGVSGYKSGSGGRSSYSPPYYFKLVTGVDPTVTTGWGVVGGFIPNGKIDKLTAGETFIFKHVAADGTNKYELFRCHGVTSSYPVHLANGTTKYIPNAEHLYSFKEWSECVAYLAKEGVVPTVTADKPETAKVLRTGSS